MRLESDLSNRHEQEASTYSFLFVHNDKGITDRVAALSRNARI